MGETVTISIQMKDGRVVPLPTLQVTDVQVKNPTYTYIVSPTFHLFGSPYDKTGLISNPLKEIIEEVMWYEEKIQSFSVVDYFDIMFENKEPLYSYTYYFSPKVVYLSEIARTFPYPWLNLSILESFDYKILTPEKFKSLYHLIYILQNIYRDCVEAETRIGRV